MRQFKQPRGHRGGEVQRKTVAANAVNGVGKGYTDFSDEFCPSPVGARKTCADFLHRPPPRGRFSEVAESIFLEISRSAKKQCVFQCHTTEIEIDGGAIQAHVGRGARLNPETLAYDSEQIFALSSFLNARLDEREELLSPTGED